MSQTTSALHNPKKWDASAESYDIQRFTLAFVDYSLGITKLEKEERKEVKVLDLAAGTGAVSLAAAHALKGRGSVVATDFSPKMLEVLKGKIQNAKLENISTQIMDAQEISFPDESFDFVFCLFGMLFIPDPKKVEEKICKLSMTIEDMMTTIQCNPGVGIVFGEAKSILISELPSLLREEFPSNQTELEPAAIIGLGTK